MAKCATCGNTIVDQGLTYKQLFDFLKPIVKNKDRYKNPNGPVRFKNHDGKLFKIRELSYCAPARTTAESELLIIEEQV
jgi:hypothetical protein